MLSVCDLYLLYNIVNFPPSEFTHRPTFQTIFFFVTNLPADGTNPELFVDLFFMKRNYIGEATLPCSKSIVIAIDELS